MRDTVKVVALTAVLLGAILAVPTAASASVPQPTHAQVTTCSRALLSHNVMTAKGVGTCLAVASQTYTPTWCASDPKGYVIDLQGREALHGKVATAWAIRAGVKPYRAGARYSDAAVIAALCGGPPGSSNLLEPIPASMSSSWTQPPAETPGPEKVGLANGPALANLSNAAVGQTVDSVQCQTSEQLVSHVHTHLTIYVNGQARVIPYGIGIPGFQAVQTAGGPFVESGNCFYWLHTHATDGVIHVESPAASDQFTLGQVFEEWGVPLSSTQVGPATGKVTVFFTAPGYQTAIFTGDPRNVPLGSHYEIQLDVGTTIVAPYKVKNWGGL